MPKFSTSLTRKTNETDVNCTLEWGDGIPGNQCININTGIGFLDHVSLKPEA